MHMTPYQCAAIVRTGAKVSPQIAKSAKRGEEFAKKTKMGESIIQNYLTHATTFGAQATAQLWVAEHQ